ncbi:MAG: HEPN domain-containing protein, partial [Deltaproteobacteria bacterium]|nr:HEPN domain-containing protein [Deltaproteobacteria bacterium]
MNGSAYDLTVVNAPFKAKKYPYALFMGHLALEKLIKAVVVKHTKAHAPFSHSLPYLAERSGLKIPESLLVKLREFMEFHLEARYPDANKEFYGKCNRVYTAARLKEPLINSYFVIASPAPLWIMKACSLANSFVQQSGAGLISLKTRFYA